MGKDDETKNKVDTFVVTPQSPYYLSSSYSPGALITAIKFDGKKIRSWGVGFIDGTITKPEMTEGDENLAIANAWEMVNSMITSWIMNVIDPKLHASVACANFAHEMWENIRKRYSVPNVPRIHKLKVEIVSCKQGNMEVVEFLSKLTSL